MGRRASGRCAWVVGACLSLSASFAQADPPAGKTLSPPPAPPPGADKGGVILGDVGALPPPPPPPPGVVIPPICVEPHCAPLNTVKSPPKEPTTRSAKAEPPAREATPRAPIETGEAARPPRGSKAPPGRPMSDPRARPFAPIDPDELRLWTERPRRSKPALAFGIVLTSVSPIAAIAGSFASAGDGSAAGIGVSVLLGVAGVGTGIGLIVYGAHRMTLEELKESRRQSAFVPAPVVTVGPGSVQATWQF